DLDEPIDTARELMDAAIKSLETFLASRHLLQALEESALIRMGDYWIICYQGHPAIFKATRGLDYLAYLLGHPGREVHVSELIGAALATLGLRGNSHAARCDAVTARLQKGVPLLDLQAKLEYKRRIEELRKDIQEAERFNDDYRLARSQGE